MSEKPLQTLCRKETGAEAPAASLGEQRRDGADGAAGRARKKGRPREPAGNRTCEPTPGHHRFSRQLGNRHFGGDHVYDNLGAYDRQPGPAYTGHYDEKDNRDPLVSSPALRVRRAGVLTARRSRRLDCRRRRCATHLYLQNARRYLHGHALHALRRARRHLDRAQGPNLGCTTVLLAAVG